MPFFEVKVDTTIRRSIIVEAPNAELAMSVGEYSADTDANEIYVYDATTDGRCVRTFEHNPGGRRTAHYDPNDPDMMEYVQSRQAANMIPEEK